MTRTSCYIFHVMPGSGLLQELQAFEVPQLMTLVDAVGGDNQICIAYKNQFDLINEKNGDTLQLYQVDTNKVCDVTVGGDNKGTFIVCQKSWHSS